LLSGFVTLALAASLPAQVAPTPPAPARPAEDSTVVLSPFIISTERDTGWSANDTLSATRTRQSLKDVPVNIDAITADFMEDLGLFTADEVANYVANVFAPTTMENDNQSGALAFRGLSGSTATRNYFRWYIPSDTYNVERIDFGKGSNSLIFGDVEPGGQGTVFTKRALLRTFGTATAYYNNDGAYRFLLDYNRRLRPNLALRLNAVRRQERTFQDASTFNLEGQTLAATWQPLRHTLVRLEYERGNFENARGFAGVYIREQSARSRAFTSAGTYFTSDGEWIQRATLPSADRSNGPAGGSPSLLEGSYFDVTMRNTAGAIIGTRRVQGLPKHYNIRGAFDRQGRPFDTYTVTIEQRLGPVGLEFSYNHQNQMALRTDNYFSSTINLDVNGRPYIDTTLDMKRFGNEVEAFRGTAVYKFDRWRWMQQLFIASAEYREDAVDNYRWQAFNIKAVEDGRAAALALGDDRGRLRLYLDDPAFYSRALFNRMKPGNLPDTATVKMRLLGVFADGGSPTAGNEWRQNYAASCLASGRYFNGRLLSLVGLRRDFGRTYAYVGTRTYGPYNEAVFPPKREDAPPGEYRENRNLHLANTTPTVGLTFALTRDINVYGVYSESFRFQDVFTFDGERFGPITGVTKEIGLKGSAFEDRLTATLGVFDIARQNVAITWNNVFDFNTTEIEDLMNPNHLRPGDPGYKYGVVGTASASRYYRSTESSKGADLTLMLRPTRSLQLRFTAARAKVAGIPDLSRFRAYYEAAVARGNESPALLNEARTLLDTLDNPNRPTGPRASPWTASWAIDYTFPRGSWRALHGVRLGAHGYWRDNYLLGITNGIEMVGGINHPVQAYGMRDQKIWNQMVRLRFGVKNLIDLENATIRKTSFTTLANGTPVYRYSYVMPPQYDLSITVRF
jgi:outer membrane receptor protein involved in Fe transport